MPRKDHAGLSTWHTMAVLALVAANLLLVAILWSIRGRAPGLHSGDLAAMFFSYGQFILLAAWCACGTGRAIWRWFVTISAFAAVTFTFSFFAARSLGRYSDGFFDLAVAGAILLLGWYALLLPFRWIFGWRLNFDDSAASARRGQFRLRHWLAWTAALGLPLAVARLASSDAGVTYLASCLFAGLFSFPFVVIYFRTAFARRPWLWSLAAVGTAIAAGIAEESIVVYGLMEGGASYPWSFRWLHIQQFCGQQLGLAAGLLGNLLILRLLGMRFVSGQKVGSADLPTAAVGWDKLDFARARPME